MTMRTRAPTTGSRRPAGERDDRAAGVSQVAGDAECDDTGDVGGVEGLVPGILLRGHEGAEHLGFGGGGRDGMDADVVGRAFAGAVGNDKARIFCRKNEAELLAINGWYRAPDEMDPATRGRPIQAYLHDGKIWVAALE